MSVTDLLIILAFFATFGAVRFGLPALACWLFRICDDRYIHPHA
jgi:hypothetical protein